MESFIPVNQPRLGAREKELVTECLDTGWISSEGPFVGQFENLFAERLGRKHAIAVTNGTAAIDATIDALNLLPGDEVIVPTFTIISCLLQIVRRGVTPVLVDSDPYHWNMNVEETLQKINSRTKAVLIPHLYGLPVDVDPILEVCHKKRITVIEDAAEAIGLRYKNRECGSLGDISTFSFYANKHITTGEGGMILTDSDDLASRLRQLRNLCFKPERRFLHDSLGYNLRMTNLQAALGIAQLERLDETIDRKRTIGRQYRKLLTDSANIQLPQDSTSYAENIYWVFGVVSRISALTADKISDILRAKHIGSRPFFYPMHLQPVFHKLGLFHNESHPVAEYLSQYGLYLPSGTALSDSDLATSAYTLKSIIKE